MGGPTVKIRRAIMKLTSNGEYALYLLVGDVWYLSSTKETLLNAGICCMIPCSEEDWSEPPIMPYERFVAKFEDDSGDIIDVPNAVRDKTAVKYSIKSMEINSDMNFPRVKEFDLTSSL
jgi:hypothetical protein